MDSFHLFLVFVAISVLVFVLSVVIYRQRSKGADLNLHLFTAIYCENYRLVAICVGIPVLSFGIIMCVNGEAETRYHSDIVTRRETCFQTAGGKDTQTTMSNMGKCQELEQQEPVLKAKFGEKWTHAMEWVKQLAMIIEFTMRMLFAYTNPDEAAKKSMAGYWGQWVVDHIILLNVIFHAAVYVGAALFGRWAWNHPFFSVRNTAEALEKCWPVQHYGKEKLIQVNNEEAMQKLTGTFKPEQCYPVRQYGWPSIVKKWDSDRSILKFLLGDQTLCPTCDRLVK
jgi:hypothetical protein